MWFKIYLREILTKWRISSCYRRCRCKRPRRCRTWSTVAGGSESREIRALIHQQSTPRNVLPFHPGKKGLHDQTSALFCLQINLLDKMSKKIPHCELVPVKTRGQSVKCSTLTKNEPVHCTVGKFQSVWYYQLSRIAFLHCERSIQWTKLQTPKHYQKGLATPNPEKGANKPQTQKRGQPTPQLQKGGKEPLSQAPNHKKLNLKKGPTSPLSWSFVR